MTTQTHAQTQSQLPPYVSYDDNYLLPLGEGKPATDLLGSDGKILNSWELEERRRVLWQSKLDLSVLGPATDYTYYSNTNPPYQWNVQDYDELDFSGAAESLGQGLNNGLFRFNLLARDHKTPYLALLSEVNYSYLIRAELLRKIGYNIPAMKRFRALKINFSSVDEKKQILNRMTSILSDKDLWIIDNPKDLPYILIQDIVLTPYESLEKFNLAIDPFLFDRTNGKRIFKALVVPYNLILSDNPSINLLPWSVGVVYSGNLRLNSEITSSFGASVEDAKWILKKISRLSREDWNDIAAASDLPGCLQGLLIEKYLSLLKTFNQQTYNQVDSPTYVEKFQCQDHVVDGKTNLDKWEGYASHFAWGDPENPLNSKEIRSITIMKILDFAFANTTNYINSLSFMSVDVGKKNIQKINQLFEESKIQSREKNEITNIPLSTWSFLTGGVHLIASRQVIVGSYQGTTNNLISMADNIGIAGDFGIFLGVAGLLPDFKAGQKLNTSEVKYNVVRSPINSVQASTGVSLIYSHIRPIDKVSDAVKQMPFKNFLVPKEKKDIGKAIARLLKVDGDVPARDQSDNENALLTDFKESILPGESFIITRRLFAKLGANLNLVFNQWVDLSIGYEGEDSVIDRIHIVRKDENTIQIYKNYANLVIPENLNAALGVIIPLARFRNQTTNINRARTDFYEVNIDPYKNPNWRQEFTGLMSVIKNGRLAKLKSVVKPIHFNFEAKEKTTQVSAAIWSWNKVKQSMKITINYPEGREENFHRDYRFFMAGHNFLEYAVDLADSLISKITRIGIDLTDYSFNPGTSPTGKAASRIAATELDDKDIIHSLYTKVTRLHNGFHMKRKQLDRLLKDIRRHYHYQFYLPEQFNNTKSISIYNSQINIHFTPGSYEYFLNLNLQETKWGRAICYQFNNSPDLNELNIPRAIDAENPKCTAWNKIQRWQKKLKENIAATDFYDVTKFASQLALYLENHLTIQGLMILMGGDEFIFVDGKFTGYRDGVEFNRDKKQEIDVYSNTLGIRPNRTFGPLSALTRIPDNHYGAENVGQNLNVSEGELFMNWALRRAY